MLRLDIISDIVCPWCYIGKTLLDRALERSPDHPFAVEWHPYLLNPQMPRAGLPYADALPAAFNGTGATLVDLDDALERAGVMIALVDHDVFRSVPLEERADKYVYDTRGIWPDQPVAPDARPVRLAS